MGQKIKNWQERKPKNYVSKDIRRNKQDDTFGRKARNSLRQKMNKEDIELSWEDEYSQE